MNFGGIYDLDSDTRSLLTVDNFLGGLTVNEFVDRLSKDHSIFSEKEYLDPKPFIRTFESTLNELQRLSEECLSKKQKCEEEVESYELIHSENVLSVSTTQTNSQFERLSDKVSQVSSVVKPMGEEFSKIANKREVSSSCVFILKCYDSFYKNGSCASLEALLNSGTKPDLIKLTETVKQLVQLSLKLECEELTNSTQTAHSIRSYASDIEAKLLEGFQQAYAESDFASMNEIFTILKPYNDGENVINLFIEKTNLYLEEPASASDSPWDRVSDLFSHEAWKNPVTEQLLSNVVQVLKTESRAIKLVFQENSLVVMKALISKMYANVISSHVDEMCRYAKAHSGLAYLRTLHDIYSQVGEFSEAVKHDFELEDFDNLSDLMVMLDSSYQECFIQYLSNDKFFETERQNLSDLILSLIASFEGSCPEKNDHPGQVSKLVLRQCQDTKVREIIETLLSAQSDRSFKKYYSFTSSGSVSVEEIGKILEMFVESLSRVVELTPMKSPEYAARLLEVVLYKLVGYFNNFLLDKILLGCHKIGGGAMDQVDLSSFKAVITIKEILYIVSTATKTIIVPLTSNAVTVQRRVLDSVNGYFKFVELAFNFLAEKLLAMLKEKLKRVLSKQKKKDFLLKTTEDLMDECTETCNVLCTLLDSSHRQISACYDEENATLLLTRMADFLLQRLIDHYSQFKINSIGSLVLTQDINRIIELVSQWAIPEYGERFLILREIVNLFNVSKIEVVNLCETGLLAQLDWKVKKQLISNRTDFEPSELSFLDNIA